MHKLYQKNGLYIYIKLSRDMFSTFFIRHNCLKKYNDIKAFQLIILEIEIFFSVSNRL